VKAATKPSAGYTRSSVSLPLDTSVDDGSGNRTCQTTLKDGPKINFADGERPSLPLDPSLEKAQDIALATIKGIGKLSKAVLSTPLYFSMGIARGFQSIPIAYCDTTVRRPAKVDSIHTGFEVAMSVSQTVDSS
jgi:hypothetical protein